MSINFSFTLKPKRKIFNKTKIELSQVEAALKTLRSEMGFSMHSFEKDIKIQFCPEGYFWITYDKDTGRLFGDCQTNVAGPGFHVAAIEMLERLADMGKLKLEVEDETQYFIHKDFDRMREEHFFPWLKSILNLICEQYTSTDFRICWPMDLYSPKPMKMTVVMPIRRFTINEIKLFYNGRIGDFAREFFIWNERERDAYFYRNSGIALMNMRCYFMPSDRSLEDERINKSCIALLESGLKRCKSLPFPREDYERLCRLHRHKPMDVRECRELECQCEIGYRKKVVYYSTGQFTFSVPGNYLQDYDEKSHTLLYYDNLPEGWHNIRVTSFTSEKEPMAFQPSLFEQEDVAKTHECAVGDGRLKLAVYQPIHDEEQPDEDYYEVVGQMILDRQLTIISVTFQNAKEQDAVIDWFCHIRGRRETAIDERTLAYNE